MREIWYQKEIDGLLETIVKINSKDELEKIFDRILTPREINDMARRLKVWKMLEQGKSYTDISMALGASVSLISRVSTKIGYGFRRSAAKTSEKREKIDSGKYLKRSIRYKGTKTGLSMR